MKCRIKVTRSVSYEVDIVGINSSDACDLARIGANESNKSEPKKDTTIEVLKIYGD